MMSASNIFCEESTKELDRLRAANDMGQRLLRGNLETFPESYESSTYSSHFKSSGMERHPQNHVEQTNTYDDLWGANEYLTNSTTINYVKQHLQNTERILQKTDALLRVCHPGTYETLDDVESLTKKCNERYGDSLRNAKHHHRGYDENSDKVICGAHEDATLLEEEAQPPTLGKFHNCDGMRSHSKQCCETSDACQPLSKGGLDHGSMEIEMKGEETVGMELVECNTMQMPTVAFTNRAVCMETDEDRAFELGLLDAILAEDQSAVSTRFGLNLEKTKEALDCVLADYKKGEEGFVFYSETELKESFQQTFECSKALHTKLESPTVSNQEPVEIALTPEFEADHQTSKDRLTELPPKEVNSQTICNEIESQKPLMPDEEELALDLSLDLSLLKCEEDYENKKQSEMLVTNRSFPQGEPQYRQICELSTDLRKELFKYNPDKVTFSVVHGSVWDILPNEIVLMIFSFLSQQDLRQASVVCHRFRAVAKDNCLWSKAEATNVELTSEWLESFTKVRHVSISRCKAKGLNTKILRGFFQRSKDTLRHVHVSQCSHKSLFGDNVLLLVSTHCRRVENVSVPWSNTTDNGMSALTMSNLQLRELDVSGNCFISDSTFITLLQRTGNSLLTLKLNGCFALSNDSFLSISETCRCVSVLEIGFCSKVTGDCLVRISSSLKNLRELNLRGLKCLNDECLISISKNSVGLIKLVIANCQLITNGGISNLAADLPNIEDLDVSGCVKITDTGACSLANSLRSPLHLNFSGTSISHETVDTLTENFYDSLESLKVSFCSNITQQCLEKLLNFCFKLKCLHVHGCKRISVLELQQSHASPEICS